MTIDVDIPDSLHVWVNRLEMELVVYNLLKNGASAMKDCETKHIAIHAQTDGPNVRLCVRDFGPVIDDRTFEQLCSPVISMKSDGLLSAEASSSFTAEDSSMNEPKQGSQQS